jgi:hypothetical protein
MGYRTVVVLNCDLTHEWSRDPELGSKIKYFADVHKRDDSPYFEYGSILECEHADVQTLAVVDGLSGQALAYSNWHANQTHEQRDLALLRALAEKQGYRLVKMPKASK